MNSSDSTGAGVNRSGPSDEGEPPLDCEGRAKSIRDELAVLREGRGMDTIDYVSKIKREELQKRWAELRIQCAERGWDIDGLLGSTPPLQIPPRSAQETADVEADELEAMESPLETSWPGEALILAVALAIAFGGVAALSALAKIAAARGEGDSPGGDGTSEDAPGPGEDGDSPPPAEEGMGPIVREILGPEIVKEPGSKPDPDPEDDDWPGVPGHREPGITPALRQIPGIDRPDEAPEPDSEKDGTKDDWPPQGPVPGIGPKAPPPPPPKKPKKRWRDK